MKTKKLGDTEFEKKFTELTGATFVDVTPKSPEELQSQADAVDEGKKSAWERRYWDKYANLATHPLANGLKDFIEKERLLAAAEEREKHPEIVICSAVAATDGTIVRGHRHHDAIRTLSQIPGKTYSYGKGDTQGFVTSKGRYVTRKKGYEIQRAAGVKSRLQGSEHASEAYLNGELYSEDLY
jgi:hypothetical protein